MIVKWCCAAVFKENGQTESCLTIKAGFIIREPASAKEQVYIQKTVGDEVYYKQNW